MAWIRRRPPVMIFMGFIVIALALATVRARRIGPQEPGSLGKIAEVSAENRAREVASIDSEYRSGFMEPSIEKHIDAVGGSKVHYFADGYSLSDPDSHNRQANWVCMLNVSKESAKVKFTFYYEDIDPTSMEYEMPPESAKSINLYNCKEVHRNRRFGAKIESSEPLVVQVTTGYYGKSDKSDWFTRAMHSVICNDTISRVNFYADGVVLEKEGSRLKEPEWAFLLNPNDEMAKVYFYAYSDAGNKIFAFEIKPQRLFPLKLSELVIKNRLFGAKFVSSVPIAVQQTRWAEEEDRRTIRSAYSVMAKPWVENEQMPGDFMASN